MATQLRILIIEDSEDDARLMLRELVRGGFEPLYERVDTAEALQAALTGKAWDLILSDYRMPGFNALAALEMVKKSGLDLPFIILSGKIGEELAAAAMKAGAHDYLMKNNLSRLVPAIERELREAEDRERRRTAEEALSSQFRQISTIFDSLNALVYVADMDNHELVFMNKFGAAMAGESWQGKKCYEVLKFDKDGPCSFCTNEKLLADGRLQPPCIWEFQNTATGRWYQCIDKAIYWPDGRLVRLEIAMDISERKEIEQMKDEMISAVSHEMRTPLTAMLGFTEFLLENEVDDAQLKTYLNTIHKETGRLKELIGNFLDLQQINARMATYRFRPVDVAFLLKDASDLFGLNQENDRFVIDCPAALPAIEGDEDRLHQVFTNIISNAIKYSPRESLISIGARQEEDNVIISVRDEGLGIPAEVQERIFDRFYRVDNTDRRATGGTGLGLALVREIVTAHGGRVWVESLPGKGSTFLVSLPIAKDPGRGGDE